MIATIDAIVDAHTADGYPISVFWGGVLDKKTLFDQITESSPTLRYLIPAPNGGGVTDDFVLASGGKVKFLKMWMVAITKDSRTAVQAGHDWLERIGFTTENGVVGYPASAPWTYQTLLINAWRTVADVNLFSEQYGDVWLWEQPVEIQVSIP